jgi:hypothetical protein
MNIEFEVAQLLLQSRGWGQPLVYCFYSGQYHFIIEVGLFCILYLDFILGYSLLKTYRESIHPPPIPPIFPVKTYANMDTQKLDILLENKDKVGIYCIINVTDGKKYVGSSINLRRRFIQYYSIGNLARYS